MKVNVLIEDTSHSSEIIGEFGLSMHLEVDGEELLFDVGQSVSTIKNARNIGIKLENAKYVVLSHGHKDHLGALSDILKITSKAKIYASSKVKEELYVDIPSEGFKYFGIEPALRDLAIIEVSDVPLFISPNIAIIRSNIKSGFLPTGNAFLYKKVNDEYFQDDFQHEIVMVVKEEDGLVVFTGCSHSGVTNMMDAAMSVFPNCKIKAVFGGFHLYNPLNQKTENEEVLTQLAEDLSNYPDTQYYTGHCTGKIAYDVLEKTLGSRLNQFYSGFTTIV